MKAFWRAFFRVRPKRWSESTRNEKTLVVVSLIVLGIVFFVVFTSGPYPFIEL